MKCPKCGSEQHRVSNTRQRLDGAIRRQRTCIICGKIWYTIETHEGKCLTMQNDNLINRLKNGIETASGIDNDFVYITIGDAKRILRML